MASPTDPPPHGTRPMLVAGRQIDHYVLTREVHQGGASHLWQATDLQADDGMPRLLKVACRTEEAMVRLEVEQALLKLLGGPHVPRHCGQGKVDGLPYLVVEQIDGPTLAHRLSGPQPLPWLEVVDLAQRLAAALHQVHRQGALHLDLQPRHIMFRPSGELVLVGWSLARHAQQPDLHDHTLDLDNSAYLAPEQIHWQRHDLRSDLYTWAVVVYQALAGMPPFGCPRTTGELRQRLAKQAVPPRGLRDDCTPWLQECLLRNLDIDPAQRHATAALLAFDLRHPDPQALTERSQWTTAVPSSGGRERWRRWRNACAAWFANDLEKPPAHPVPGAPLCLQLHTHPLVMVLLDPRANAATQTALRRQVDWVLSGAPHAHLACVAWVDTSTPESDAEAPPSWPASPVTPSPLAQARHWTHPLMKHGDPQRVARLSHHVIECTDGELAETVGRWARQHLVDQVLLSADLGTPGCLGRLGAQMACTLTLVHHAAA
ncbi:MAG: serine/threonine-protein kinase [Pseudomonadota bacterium]